MAKLIEDKIKKNKWAPDVIENCMESHDYFRKEEFNSITTPTICNAIRFGIINVKLKILEE